MERLLDGVLSLGVPDGGVVSDARVGADLAVVAYYGGASYCCAAVDDGAFSYRHVVYYIYRIYMCSYTEYLVTAQNHG